jgi:dUTP pyrophosphatase
MISFETVSKYADDAALLIPKRSTAASAGYDFVVAEDIIIPPYELQSYEMSVAAIESDPMTLSEIAHATKVLGTRPVLVSTGVKCQMPSNVYLELSVRSSTPLKHWLIMANSVGVIDADYYNNPDNEGEIFFQLINLGPRPILLQKGDKIGQGIFKNYLTVSDDAAGGERIGGFGSTSV